MSIKLPTVGVWLFDELAPMIGWQKSSIYLKTPNYGGFKVKTSSMRLECLIHNSKCVKCGLVGSIWLLQAHHTYVENGQLQLRETPHLNLYAIDDDNELVLMTRDHIIPTSKGGPNIMENLQTMCERCNQAKGNSLFQVMEILAHYKQCANQGCRINP